MKTNYVKTGLYSRYINLGFFVLMAALLLSSLVTGCKQNVIKKKIPYPDPQPYPNAADYKVEHWQQNIEGSDYTLYEKETLEGKVGENTKAQAKNYAGFMNLTIDQKKITDDNSTVVQIKYNRKEITLTLNLNGGSTTTHLIEGNKLKGRFGAPVPVVNTPTKAGTLFGNWNPDIPFTFPAESTAHAVVWTDSSYRIIIKGDERTNIPQGTFINIPLAQNKTWSNIKDQAKDKVTLKSEWKGGDYKVYEWRFNNENGELLTETAQMNKPLTVYAVTNYNKFNIEDNKIKLTADGKGYTGSKPKGKIIIPDGITEIEEGFFFILNYQKAAFMQCDGIKSVRFPAGLSTIGVDAFSQCEGLTSLDLSSCTSLSTIGDNAFSQCEGLTSLDLSACTSLSTIGRDAFSWCEGLTSLNLSSCTNPYHNRQGCFFSV